MDQDAKIPRKLQKARRELLAEAGGTHDTATVAELLGLTPEEVREKARRGALLSIDGPSGTRRYPRAQFSGTGLLEGLEEVLGAMHVRSPWMRLQLALDYDVLGALQDGRVEDAKRAVDSYLPRYEG